MSDKPLVLKSLEIHANNRWSATTPDYYVAEITYHDEETTITTRLGPEFTATLLDLVASELVKSAQQAAETLTAKTITQTTGYLPSSGTD